MGGVLSRRDTLQRVTAVRGRAMYEEMSRRTSDRAEEGQGLQSVCCGEFDSDGTSHSKLVSPIVTDDV